MTREEFEMAVREAHRLVTTETAHMSLQPDDVVIEVNPVTFAKLMADEVITPIESTSPNWSLAPSRDTYMETSDGHPVRSTRRVRGARQVRGIFEAEAWVRVP